MNQHSQHRQPWVVVMDGQPTLWEQLEAVLKDTLRVEILDLLHANGYLWEAVHLFHPPGSNQALALMKLCLLALLKGRAQTLMSWLIDQAQRCGLSSAQRQRLAKISDYFHRHRHRVQYDQYLAAGYPIASGVIEGACRHVVKDRMERTGMHWTLPGAQAMLQLRCIALNGQWEDSCSITSNKKWFGYTLKDLFIGPHRRPCPGLLKKRKFGYARQKKRTMTTGNRFLTRHLSRFYKR